MNTVNSIYQIIGYFMIGYPLGMAIVWIIGGLIYWWKNERLKQVDIEEPIEGWPYVTILIPCHNEEQIIANTCKQIYEIDYPKYRVVFIDDASSDNTSDAIRKWIRNVPNFHLLRIQENQGKSNALNTALAVTGSTPITIIMDADTLPHPKTVKILVKYLVKSNEIGAVTGNPIVYNRNNILEKLQAVEFTSIIGLIKRAQNLYGHIFSISGCITAFKTVALFQVGGFSAKTATEDIDITWRLQKASYQVVYIPQALAYIQVPNKPKEFWKQRKRWALGGWHLLRTHIDIFSRWNWRRLWPVYLDILLSYIWSLLFFGGGIIWLVTNYLLYEKKIGLNPYPNYASILIIICIIQLTISIRLNRQYDKKIWKLYFLISLYPIFYFFIGALSVCRMSVKGIFKNLDSVGKWSSPTRINLKKIKEQ